MKFAVSQLCTTASNLPRARQAGSTNLPLRASPAHSLLLFHFIFHLPKRLSALAFPWLYQLKEWTKLIDGFLVAPTKVLINKSPQPTCFWGGNDPQRVGAHLFYLPAIFSCGCEQFPLKTCCCHFLGRAGRKLRVSRSCCAHTEQPPLPLAAALHCTAAPRCSSRCSFFAPVTPNSAAGSGRLDAGQQERAAVLLFSPKSSPVWLKSGISHQS